MTVRDVIATIRDLQDRCCGVHPQACEGPMFCEAWGCATLNAIADQLEQAQTTAEVDAAVLVSGWGIREDWLADMERERDLAVAALTELVTTRGPIAAYAEDDECLLHGRREAAFERAYHVLDVLPDGDPVREQLLLEHYAVIARADEGRRAS